MDALQRLGWEGAHPTFAAAVGDALGEDELTEPWDDEDSDTQRDPWRQLCHRLSIGRYFAFAPQQAAGHAERKDLQSAGRPRETDSRFMRLFDHAWRGLELADCIRSIPEDLELVRVREVAPHSSWFEDEESLGAPPWRRAGAPNRFSAAGVPVFYGSNRLSVATAEIVRRTGVTLVSAGRWTWRDTTPATVVALERLPTRPGPFFRSKLALRRTHGFLASFVANVSAPPGGDVLDVEYAATQAFAEYLCLFRSVSAVSYLSHRVNGGVHWAIFPTLEGTSDRRSPNERLRLREHVRVTSTRSEADGQVQDEVHGRAHKRRRAWR